MKKTALSFFASVTIIHASFAQTKKIAVDKIVAQIEDKTVLQSDIDRYKNACDGPFSPCVALEAELLQKLLLISGKKNVHLTEKEITKAVDNRMQFYLVEYELPHFVTKSIDQVKEEITPEIKERLLIDKMRQRILDTIRICHQEVKAFFDKIPFDSLPLVDAKFELRQIVLYPKPIKAADDSLINLLLDWKSKIKKGQKKFDALARLYTQDPGSRETGGEYAVNKHDKQWDKAWFAAIWKLKIGQISPVVKSAFGLHIIQLLTRDGDDAVIRHILLIPPISQTEIDKTVASLNSIRSKIAFDSISFSKAAILYNQDELSKVDSGAILSSDNGSYFVTIDELDKSMTKRLRNMQPGDISKAEVFRDDRLRDAVRIIFLKSKKEEHHENLKDDYDDIAKQALEEKKKMILQKWVISHAADYEVAIDTSFNACVNLTPWLSTKSQ